MSSVFRPYSADDALRKDRSAADRKRHRDKLRRSLKDNIADVIAEESIIGQNRDRVIKVPIKGIKEYRFVFGDNQGGVASGDGNTQPGQTVGKAKQGSKPGQGPAGSEPGVDYYETEISLDELIDIMFEDLELPDLQRKILKEAECEKITKRLGYKKKGIRAHLDRKRSVRQKRRRQIASRNTADAVRLDNNPDSSAEDEASFPFRDEDLTYKRQRIDTVEQSNAVVFCVMDTSGSMDRTKKYLARSFFFLLYQFVATKYQNVSVIFVGHHTVGKEVTEDEFFHKGESGGTLISSGYEKVLEIIDQRYHPELWNIYAFHCSDGDNFDHDNERAVAAARQICAHANLFGYGEIKPMGSHFYESSMISTLSEIDADNFTAVLIERRDDIWPAFRKLIQRDRDPASIL